MTFDDPIKMDGEYMALTPSHWPASTHLHGAEVRPTFDGNPLSWIANNGARGLAAFSLSDKCYYDAFDQADTTKKPSSLPELVAKRNDQHDKVKNSFMPPEIVVKRVGNDEEIQVLPQAKINRYPNIQNPGILFYHDHAMNMTKYNVQNGLSGIYILRNPKVEK